MHNGLLIGPLILAREENEINSEFISRGIVGRPLQQRLDAAVAEKFRDAARAALGAAGTTQASLANVQGLPQRTVRWVHLVLKKGSPLAVVSALEIAQRMRARNVRLSERILNLILVKQFDSPIVLLQRGEGNKLADYLTNEIYGLPGLGAIKRAQIIKRIERALEPYENLSESAKFASLLESMLETVVGPKRGFLNRRRVFSEWLYAVAIEEDRVIVPGTLDIGLRNHRSSFPKSPDRKVRRKKEERRKGVR